MQNDHYFVNAIMTSIADIICLERLRSKSNETVRKIKLVLSHADNRLDET